MIPPDQDADFVCAMEQVLDVYQRPYDASHPVICLDETTKQLVGETRKPIHRTNGQVLFDYEYARNGVADLYMLFEPLAAKRWVLVKNKHTRIQWAQVIAHIAQTIYPTAHKITIVQDNLSAHKPSALYEIMKPEQATAILRKLEFLHTPKHGSWLNMAEIEFSALARQCLNQRIPDHPALIDSINKWQLRRNKSHTTVNWQFTSNQARIKLKRLYPTFDA